MYSLHACITGSMVTGHSCSVCCQHDSVKLFLEVDNLIKDTAFEFTMIRILNMELASAVNAGEQFVEGVTLSEKLLYINEGN